MDAHELLEAAVGGMDLEDPALQESEDQAVLPRPFPAVPIPLLLGVSGLYEWRLRLPLPINPLPFPVRPSPLPKPGRPGLTEEQNGATESAVEDGAADALRGLREELRLDVDGRYPQMTASGTLHGRLSPAVHWVAKLVRTGLGTWGGPIWYKDGAGMSFPYTRVDITAVRSWFPNQRRAKAVFTGPGGAKRVRTYAFRSTMFRRVEFEFDCAAGTTPVLQIDTHDHPNRPPTLHDETLGIPTVFRRAGFSTATLPAGGVVPLGPAGSDGRWSDAEMHDAMQVYWSRFANAPQWSMWVFFAALHEWGASLGGIMFDDIGPNHRQGTAIFNDSFIKNAPAGDPAPAAWVKRMRFWTAVHEMGHGFNLAHSWQKELGAPWIPLVNEPEARSFMNYPYSVAGGQAAFFSDFEFRFSDGELLFMRHAPERFVRMGDAAWFDHHGFGQAQVAAQPALRLEVRANRASPTFEFLEPVVLELKLTNVTDQPLIVPRTLLSNAEDLTVVIKKEGRPARQHVPFARRCLKPEDAVLQPGQSLYEPLFPAVGINGWELAEPGRYTIHVALHRGDEDIVSRPLPVHIRAPQKYDEERLAQDFFTIDVGRVIAFDGSRVLNGALDTLREARERFADQPVARHAAVALGMALARDYKLLDIPQDVSAPLASAAAVGGELDVLEADPDEARDLLAGALSEGGDEAAQSLGHIDYRYYAETYADWLAEEGDREEASRVEEELLLTLQDRGVLSSVLAQVKARIDRRNAEAGERAPKKAGAPRSTKSRSSSKGVKT